MKILILENDKNLCDYLAKNLQQYQIYIANSISIAKQIYSLHKIDLVLLDIDLDSESGLDFLELINTNVLMITADDSYKTISQCFEYGCIDYITKPFSLNLLKIKIEKYINSDIVQGDLRINFNTKTCYLNSQKLNLTKKEFELLEILVKNRKIVLTKERLIHLLWGNSVDVNDNTLTVTIKRLREKIENDPKSPKYIETVFSIGYCWSDYGIQAFGYHIKYYCCDYITVI